MNGSIHELPQTIAVLLRTVGPIHETAQGGYFYSLSVVLPEGGACRGFLIEQRIAEKQIPHSEGTGLTFQVPVRAEAGSEPTYVFAATLPAALAYIEQSR